MDGPHDEICEEDRPAVSLCGAQRDNWKVHRVEARLMNCLCFGCRAGALELIANLP
jgi:hypothetical protein